LPTHSLLSDRNSPKCGVGMLSGPYSGNLSTEKLKVFWTVSSALLVVEMVILRSPKGV